MAPTAVAEPSNLYCEAGPSRLATVTSRPLRIQHACHLEQPDAASWFGSQDSIQPSGQSDQHSIPVDESLADRYVETLWLGEHHSGLAHFLNCIDRLRSSHDVEDVLLGLCHLIRSNSAISRRHQVMATKLLPAANPGAQCSSEDTLDASEYEMLLAQRAVEAAGSNITSTEADSMHKRWISSMESRETQLQILITMCLLHIVSQDPRALETARSRLPGTSSEETINPLSGVNTGTSMETESEQPRKRSRKLEKAKRWRGTRPQFDSSDAFAWNQQVRRRMATDSSHDDGENGEVEVLEVQGGEVLTVDHLSKRLEALVDILCLRQVAAGVGSEIADLLSDLDTEINDNKTMDRGGKKTSGALLGSSVRKLLEDDDMDDAQWLCSSVVEPHFEASLPRQCSLFRSKCFVSLQSRTPARPTKSARTGSSGSPPMRVLKRSSSVAPLGGASASLAATGGLSDVLEKEQAGRRVKRNIMAERSSMLGRGREVDMGRRLSRSVSATSGAVQEMRAPTGVFSRSNTNAAYSQPAGLGVAKPLHARSSVENGSANGRSASQRVEKVVKLRSPMLPSMPSFAASPPSSAPNSKRLLVMSTPQKEPVIKTLSLSQSARFDKPKLVYPNSLVMESPTQEGSKLLGHRTGIAERCVSFAGRSSFALNRSPSPVAIYSDADD
ncbi:DNA replication regulator Sld3 [Kalmanozyma brasiliensis GHG001]|uniref:DNA replication regulator Sld3 C-terminal domain-containing protein n=1 Tax=Kalmanozyma brasiliensis (strain GHG001) TaxID=1365824 RepID=V5EFR8_KALBG|nr:DNA replication regulator Sld3 [Kalmanozyma brasiliensis GHG001]EST09366.1 DNA replication regulator Sld3 [Kalmanozyma brasiliensis GHG001]